MDWRQGGGGKGPLKDACPISCPKGRPTLLPEAPAGFWSMACAADPSGSGPSPPRHCRHRQIWASSLPDCPSSWKPFLHVRHRRPPRPQAQRSGEAVARMHVSRQGRVTIQGDTQSLSQTGKSWAVGAGRGVGGVK